jgi:hypothetical protein
LLGYRFSTSIPQLTISPIAGFHRWTETNKGSTSQNYIVFDFDMETAFSSYLLGMQAIYQVHPKWELGLATTVGFTSRGKSDTSAEGKLLGVTIARLDDSWDLDNTTYYKIEVPASYAFSEGLGGFFMFEQTFNRKFSGSAVASAVGLGVSEVPSQPESGTMDLNAWKIRVGVLHRF